MTKSTRADKPDQNKKKDGISMHENIPVWHDCCSCEAEPYWVEAMASQNEDKNGQDTDPEK